MNKWIPKDLVVNSLFTIVKNALEIKVDESVDTKDSEISGKLRH